MNDIISKLIIAVVTFGLGLVGARLLRKRKILEYDVFSMPLLRFTPKKERTLAVTVDKFLLTGDDKDKGQPEPITNAYGFEVNVRNVGNEEVREPSIDITLHESAKIVEYETNPASQTNYAVTFERVAPNILRVLVPYINHREQFLLRVISTENETRDCEVSIRGLGVRARRFNEMRSGLRLFGTLMITALSAAIILTLFQSFATTETVTTTKEVVHYPAWLILGLIVYAATPIIAVFSFDMRHRPKRAREYGSGGIVIVQDWDLDKRK